MFTLILQQDSAHRIRFPSVVTELKPSLCCLPALCWILMLLPVFPAITSQIYYSHWSLASNSASGGTQTKPGWSESRALLAFFHPPPCFLELIRCLPLPRSLLRCQHLNDGWQLWESWPPSPKGPPSLSRWGRRDSPEPGSTGHCSQMPDLILVQFFWIWPSCLLDWADLEKSGMVIRDKVYFSPVNLEPRVTLSHLACPHANHPFLAQPSSPAPLSNPEQEAPPQQGFISQVYNPSPILLFHSGLACHLLLKHHLPLPYNTYCCFNFILFLYFLNICVPPPPTDRNSTKGDLCLSDFALLSDLDL